MVNAILSQSMVLTFTTMSCLGLMIWWACRAGRRQARVYLKKRIPR